MLYIPKIDHYLNILTDEEVKDFVAINFSEYFKSSKLSKLSSKNCILHYVRNKILEKLLNRFISF